MLRHHFREEPLHDVIGKPNSAYPEIADLCGHVDEKAQKVCIMTAEDHRTGWPKTSDKRD